MSLRTSQRRIPIPNHADQRSDLLADRQARPPESPWTRAYVLHGHRDRAATLDLNRPWPQIASSLLTLLDAPPTVPNSVH
jgi:hypothetical protein